ncbi:histidine phosphatase family protein [Neobacillus niacini]|uniref:histidine phosphatase family protein n=1 Tax=Neobacillus niacini TaxID=86668 RepID=UPI0021CB944A|nr:histidine phosphatase family protein [Neobacillus niacini]MCM3765510.1 histidine phosphatase family protein [Neobacillus niacini]
MQITLIRHLPTNWNKKRKLQGKRDIEISPITDEFIRGIEENRCLLNELAPFDVVLASSLKRTHQTAEAYGFDAETEGLLDELDFGPLEGYPKGKLVEAYGEEWIDNPLDLVLGESLIDFEERIVQFLKKYRYYQNILVFGHGSWIRALISYYKYGHINRMNKMVLENNSIVTLKLGE